MSYRVISASTLSKSQNPNQEKSHLNLQVSVHHGILNLCPSQISWFQDISRAECLYSERMWQQYQEKNALMVEILLNICAK